MVLEIITPTQTRDGNAWAKDVSLTVERGKVTAFLGAKGAGKSVLVLDAVGLMLA